MRVIPFNIDRTKRPCGAEVLAGAAADTFVLVNGRHLHCAVRAFVVDHLDGTSGAVAGTVAAADAVGQHHAVFLDPYGMTDMLYGFLFSCDGLDGTCGAHLAASCAFGTAVAALERHRGLHEVHQVG